MFDVIRIPAFKDNYIWLLRQGSLAAVVDPGDAAPVLEFLHGEGLSLSSILITHHHQDHQGGIGNLLGRFPSAEVCGPERESITGMTAPLRGGERIRPALLDFELRVLAVPGHTLGHLAYYGEGCLFCGDALFAGGCGRLFEGTPVAMAESLARLAALPDDTRVYCAHEYTEANLRFALAVEKATNPFLRCGAPEVIAAARTRGAADDPVAVFAALREWKNEF
jgi:hydroxyacylglutathione hydrolase